MSPGSDTSGEESQVVIPPELVSTLKAANHLVVFTGSGVSAESGIPTFRDALTGLWTQYNPENLATPEPFRRDPKLVWEWYAWRRARAEAAQPNPGHCAIALMAKLVPRFTLITQNVDGLHQRAGSTDVLELHGNIRRVKCFAENGWMTGAKAWTRHRGARAAAIGFVPTWSGSAICCLEPRLRRLRSPQPSARSS